MTKRNETDYEIESVSKAVNVLMALEGTSFEPVSIQKIIERTGFSRDFCTRALVTWKIKGFAEQLPNKKWKVGAKILRFSQRYSEIAIAAINK
jgi:DNA-binding IclR family transcriptional regulator